MGRNKLKESPPDGNSPAQQHHAADDDAVTQAPKLDLSHLIKIAGVSACLLVIVFYSFCHYSVLFFSGTTTSTTVLLPGLDEVSVVPDDDVLPIVTENSDQISATQDEQLAEPSEAGRASQQVQTTTKLTTSTSFDFNHLMTAWSLFPALLLGVYHLYTFQIAYRCQIEEVYAQLRYGWNSKILTPLACLVSLVYMLVTLMALGYDLAFARTPRAERVLHSLDQTELITTSDSVLEEVISGDSVSSSTFLVYAPAALIGVLYCLQMYSITKSFDSEPGHPGERQALLSTLISRTFRSYSSSTDGGSVVEECKVPVDAMVELHNMDEELCLRTQASSSEESKGPTSRHKKSAPATKADPSRFKSLTEMIGDFDMRSQIAAQEPINWDSEDEENDIVETVIDGMPPEQNYQNRANAALQRKGGTHDQKKD